MIPRKETGIKKVTNKKGGHELVERVMKERKTNIEQKNKQKTGKESF